MGADARAAGHGVAIDDLPGADEHVGTLIAVVVSAAACRRQGQSPADSARACDLARRVWFTFTAGAYTFAPPGLSRPSTIQRDKRSLGVAARRTGSRRDRKLLAGLLLGERRLHRVLLGLGRALRLPALDRRAPARRARRSRRAPPRPPCGPCPAPAARSSSEASRIFRTLPKWRSSSRWRVAPMPGDVRQRRAQASAAAAAPGGTRPRSGGPRRAGAPARTSRRCWAGSESRSLALGRNTRSGRLPAFASAFAFLRPALARPLRRRRRPAPDASPALGTVPALSPRFAVPASSACRLALPLLGQRDDGQPRPRPQVDAHVARRRQRHPQLPLAAVDHDQIGQLPGAVLPGIRLARAPAPPPTRAPLARPPEPPRQHLVHRGEVVGAAARRRRWSL